MKSIKGLALGAALAGVVFTGAANADAATIGKDVAGTKYQESTTKLAALNITRGFPDGTVRPDENVTRAQTAAFMIRALNYQLSMDQSTTIFSDVAYEHPLSGAIQLASGRDIIKGYLDGTFRAEESVTIAQASAILVRMLGYSPAINEADFPNSHLSKAAELGLLKNVQADVNAPAKRGDIMLMISNALTVDIMKQDSWGTDQKWAEQEDKNILTEFFDLTVIETKNDFKKLKAEKYEGDLPQVSKTARTNIGSVKADELEFDGGLGGTYTLNEMFNATDFLAQEVQVWVDEDEDYVAYIANSKDQKVIFDKVDKFQTSNKNIKLDNGDDYDILKDAKIYYNLDKAVERDKFAFKTVGTTLAKAVLDSNDDVVALVLTDMGNSDYGVVEDVNTGKETINFLDGSAKNNQIKLDGKKYFVVRDGNIATLADVEAEDVINAYKNDKGDYYVMATSAQASGEIEDVKTTDFTVVSKYDLIIDGKKYDVAPYATFSENKNEDIDEVTTDDLDEMDGVKATLYLDAAGDVQHIVSGELDSTVGNVAVITKAPKYSDFEEEWKLTLVNELGKEVVYRFDSDDIDTYIRDANGKKGSRAEGTYKFIEENLTPDANKPIFIEYDVDKNNELKAVTILDNVKNTKSLELDKYDDSIAIAGGTYKVSRNSVFFDVSKGWIKDEWDDVDTIAWDNLKSKDKKILTEAYYTVKSNGRDVEYMFIMDADGSLTSKGEYGYITGFSKVGRDDAVRITRIDGEKLTLVYDKESDIPAGKQLDEKYDKKLFAKGAFIRYELDSDGEIDKSQILASAGTKGGFYTTVGKDTGWAVDSIVSGEVSKSTASTVTLKGAGNIVVNSNTVYVDLIDDGEMEITNGVDVGDFILAVDSDDDGVAADFVVIIKEDKTKVDPDGDDAIEGSGIVTYVNADKYEIEVEDKDGKVVLYTLTGSARDLVNKVKEGDKVELKFTGDRLTDIKVLGAVNPDADKAAGVDTQINKLPAVDKLTLEDNGAVEAARAAYDALTADQKKLVKDLATLEAAEAKIAELAEAGLDEKEINGTHKSMMGVDVVEVALAKNDVVKVTVNGKETNFSGDDSVVRFGAIETDAIKIYTKDTVYTVNAQ